MVGQGPLETGLHYFAVENLDTGLVEQRGTAGSAGIAFSNLVIAPSTRYRLWVLQASSLRLADVVLTTPSSGQDFQIPDFLLYAPNPQDDDVDGLPNVCEHVLGTIPGLPGGFDTDGDGVGDGAEVRNGTDPLDNRVVTTQLIASADTPGQALDVCAIDNLAIVADGDAGVSVFNIFASMAPQVVARVDTPGTASRVAYTTNRVLVADGFEGLVVIDISDPPAAQIERIVPPTMFGGSVGAVVGAADVAFVGSATGRLSAVELGFGQVLSSIELGLGFAIVDIAVSRNFVFALTADGVLHRVANEPGMLVADPQDPSILTSIRNGARRLFVGGDLAYVTHGSGTNEVDVSPGRMALVRPGSTQQVWDDFVTNGSGIGVAVAFENVNPAIVERDILIYNVLQNPQAPNDPIVFTGRVDTPGSAKSVAIFNGQAYVADRQAGLHVINYQAFDTGVVPPTIGLTSKFGLISAEEGQRTWVAADVTDDVQVRNVEFYLDGERVLTDGNFPFELFFVVPELTATQQNFRLRARASDTGGNAVWTQEHVIQITSDVTPPFVVGTTPSDGSLIGRVDAIGALFSEPIDPATLSLASFSLVEAGGDGVFGGGDDVTIVDGVPEFRDLIAGAFRTFGTELSPGRYQATVGTGVADVAGNAMAADSTWEFIVYGSGGPDSDQDGVSDALEDILGRDPNDPGDADHDFDGDGVSDLDEINIFGTDPTSVDTDGDGIDDGDEDTDLDRLTDSLELIAGTDPFDPDTDADGFDDFSEIGNPPPMLGSDPLDPASVPIRTVVSRIAMRNDAGLRDIVMQISVRNDAVPEAVSRTTMSRLNYVENTQ